MSADKAYSDAEIIEMAAKQYESAADRYFDDPRNRHEETVAAHRDLAKRLRQIARDRAANEIDGRLWRRAAMQAMRYLDREQVAKVCAESGMQLQVCGGRPTLDHLPANRQPFDLQAAIYLAAICCEWVRKGWIGERSQIGDALLDFASTMYGDANPFGGLERDYQTLKEARRK